MHSPPPIVMFTKDKILCVGLFGRVFFHSSSHIYGILLKNGREGGRTLHSGWDQNLYWGDWSAGGQNLRQLVRNVLTPRVLIIRVLFKPPHCSAGTDFPLHLRGMTLLGCQILESLESDESQTRPLASHFCNFLICISQDSLYSKSACVGLYQSPNKSFLQLIDKIQTTARKPFRIQSNFRSIAMSSSEYNLLHLIA